MDQICARIRIWVVLRATIMSLVAAAALAGCGAATRHARPERPGHLFHADGISARIPAGWHVIARPVTAMSSPLQALVVTSFAFRQRRPDGGCSPVTALRQMPAHGALLYMFEYQGPTHHDVSGWPARPEHFRLDPRTLQPYECVGRSYMVRFRDHGRVFQAHVFLGPRAGAGTRGRLLGILDSLRIGPQSARDAAIWVPPSRLLARSPYMGVSCRIGNSVACDRVGLAVWLRASARAVTATVDGRRFRLDDLRWSGPARHGLRHRFAGFLKPAGLMHGPLSVHTDSSKMWTGQPAVRAGVGLMIERSRWYYVRTSLTVDLQPGWG